MLKGANATLVNNFLWILRSKKSRYKKYNNKNTLISDNKINLDKLITFIDRYIPDNEIYKYFLF